MIHSAFLMLCTGLSLVTHLATGQQHAPVPSMLVITNVNVVDVVAGEVLPNRMVVVLDGCITSVGQQAPAGRAVQRLDGRGKYLVPGLWDTQVQAPAPPAQQRALLLHLVTRGITSIRYVSASPDQAALRATVLAVEAGQQVGPRMLLATSAAPPPARSGDLLTELAGLVAAGRTAAEALRAATLLPAAAAGYRYTLGQVAPDFRADLVLLDANPLDDIAHLQRVRAVVLRGRVFDRAALDALTPGAHPAPELSRTKRVKVADAR